MRNCYVYMYSDNGLPFYIGLGVGQRYMHHLWKAMRPAKADDTYNVRKVRKILSQGRMPIILKLRDGLTRDEAVKLEIDLIKAIGRKDRGVGCLTNLTDGGEGVVGFKHSAELRKIISERQKGNTYRLGKKISKESRERMSVAKRNISTETREKMSAAKRGITVDKNVAMKRMESLKGQKQPAYKCKYCEKLCSPATLSRWHNENCKLKGE